MGADRSPFLEPGASRRRDYRSRRHGRRAHHRHRRLERGLRRGPSSQTGAKRKTIGAILTLAVIFAIALILAGSLTKHNANAHAARLAASLTGVSGAVASNAPIARSPAGLTLGTPALTLVGLGDEAADQIHQYFATAPRAGLLFNLTTGQVLWQLHPSERAPIASLTKMMTALLSVHATTPSTRVKITREAVEMPGSSMGTLPLGREVPVEPLMYGLLLPSGNNAAVALAQHVGGNLPHFVTLMNEEAARLGLGCTHYSNPSGYFDQNNYSCAQDLAELAYEDLAQARIANIVRQASATLPFPIPGGKVSLVNNNPLLMYGYPGVIGVKTGFTEAAGTCLVAAAERNGVRLGVVLLRSPAPGTQAQQLLNDAFQQIYHQPARAEPTIPGGA